MCYEEGNTFMFFFAAYLLTTYPVFNKFTKFTDTSKFKPGHKTLVIVDSVELNLYVADCCTFFVVLVHTEAGVPNLYVRAGGRRHHSYHDGQVQYKKNLSP